MATDSFSLWRSLATGRERFRLVPEGHVTIEKPALAYEVRIDSCESASFWRSTSRHGSDSGIQARAVSE